jgi:hypothetical protein
VIGLLVAKVVGLQQHTRGVIHAFGLPAGEEGIGWHQQI